MLPTESCRAWAPTRRLRKPDRLRYLTEHQASQSRALSYFCTLGASRAASGRILTDARSRTNVARSTCNSVDIAIHIRAACNGSLLW